MLEWVIRARSLSAGASHPRAPPQTAHHSNSWSHCDSPALGYPPNTLGNTAFAFCTPNREPRVRLSRRSADLPKFNAEGFQCNIVLRIFVFIVVDDFHVEFSGDVVCQFFGNLDLSALCK